VFGVIVGVDYRGEVIPKGREQETMATMGKNNHPT
jgi:hypothetical protein